MADLITSTRAKQSINQATFTTAEDAQIASLVSAASLAIERLCRRTFASTAYDEYLDGNPCDRDSYHLQAPDQFLVLGNYPIVSITSVSIDGTVLAPTEYTSLASKGMLRR